MKRPMHWARAASLLGVLLLARCFTLADANLLFSIWTPVAYLWQDVLTVLVFASLDPIVRREWFAWTLYSLIVVYVAVNVGVTRVLNSPLTWTMIRAAGGPLADSVKHHLTAANVGAIGAVLGAGLLLPILLARVHPKIEKAATVLTLAIAAAIVSTGPYSVTRIDTAGRYRNAFGALWPISLPRVAAASRDQDWRSSPFGSIPVDDLSKYRGAASGRNVVLISLESTAASYLKPFGAELDPMPNLTGFASHGILFDDAYSVYPESIKGLYSLLCSRYPAFGVEADVYAAVSCASLPQQFAAAGYKTALFHSGRFMYLGMEAVVQKRGFDLLEDAGAIGGNIHSSFGVDEPATVARILYWIDSLKPNQHFLAVYLPIAGHHPYATPGPGPFPSDGVAGSYRNALHYGDESLGALFRGFRDRGLDRNTLFVIFGDHGEAFGEHAGNFGHTLFIYNENIHVPYIIAAPGLIETQVRVRRPVSLIDTAPTILDLEGLPVPTDYQGTSLLDPRPRMALFFTDYSLGWLGLTDSCWKYLYEINSRRSRLYEICRDPNETRDLSAAYSDRVEFYRIRAEQWIGAQKRN
jgi:lipoteichoic acid synthase